MKSKFNLFIGIVLFMLGSVLLCKQDAICVIDFLLGFVNLAIFCSANKKR